MTPEDAFRITVKEVRKEKNISQEKLALKSGVDRTFMSRIERGLSQPTLKTILKLCRGLGISSSELMEKIESKGIEIDLN